MSRSDTFGSGLLLSDAILAKLADGVVRRGGRPYTSGELHDVGVPRRALRANQRAGRCVSMPFGLKHGEAPEKGERDNRLQTMTYLWSPPKAFMDAAMARAPKVSPPVPLARPEGPPITPEIARAAEALALV